MRYRRLSANCTAGNGDSVSENADDSASRFAGKTKSTGVSARTSPWPVCVTGGVAERSGSVTCCCVISLFPAADRLKSTLPIASCARASKATCPSVPAATETCCSPRASSCTAPVAVSFTVNVPSAPVLLESVTGMRILSPPARKRGNVGVSTIGSRTRRDAAAAPYSGPANATAIRRNVPLNCGNVNRAVPRPRASVLTSPVHSETGLTRMTLAVLSRRTRSRAAAGLSPPVRNSGKIAPYTSNVRVAKPRWR